MASQSVLDTPELLSRIIELSTPKEQVAAAQICQAWNKLALSTIWGELKSFVPLLELLAPLQHDGTSWEFSSDTNIKFEDWERLRYHGRYVRSIIHNDGTNIKTQNGYVRTRTYLTLAAAIAHREDFLPNLQTLEWTISQASSIIAVGVLASPNIKELTLNIKSDVDATRVFNSLLGRMGNLTTVTINLPFETSIDVVDDCLSRFLGEQSKLSILKLPPLFLSEKLLKSIEDKKLRRLEQPERGNRRSHDNPLGSKLNFNSDAFSTLTSLDCDMDISAASTIFSAAAAPRCLTKLYIATRRLSDVADLRTFLGTLVSTNPMITALSLNLYTFGSITDVKAITFEDVSQTLRLDMTEFTITHDLPLVYNTSNIDQMGKAWPKMDYLSLNDEPLVQDAISSPPGIALESLAAFTSYFPVMATLGVYMRVEEGFESTLIAPKVRFKKLENLRVGTSTIVGADPEEIATFLAYLVPNLKVSIVTTFSSWYPRPSESVVNNSEWSGVVNCLSACFKAQKRLLQALKDQEALLEEQRTANAKFQETERNLQGQIEVLRAAHELCLVQVPIAVEPVVVNQAGGLSEASLQEESESSKKETAKAIEQLRSMTEQEATCQPVHDTGSKS